MRERLVSIGRGSGCDICLTHPSISTRHAEVTLLADGRLHVVDLGSSNGTFLIAGHRRIRIRSQVIERTATLVFGSYRTTAAGLLAHERSRPGVPLAEEWTRRCPQCSRPETSPDCPHASGQGASR